MQSGEAISPQSSRPQQSKELRFSPMSFLQLVGISPANFQTCFNTPTVFTNVPMFSIDIDTTSPSANVKSFPGTKPVPVIKKHPCGNLSALNNQPASSGSFR